MKRGRKPHIGPVVLCEYATVIPKEATKERYDKAYAELRHAVEKAMKNSNGYEIQILWPRDITKFAIRLAARAVKK